MARKPKPKLAESDLKKWKLVERFHAVLHEVASQQGVHPSWLDPQRSLQLADYLGLFLFGLFNPVVNTMRGLCEASRLSRVQTEVCRRPVSLGSFSEAQHVLDPLLLERVFEQLAAQLPSRPSEAARWNGKPWQIVDSTLWEALPRMHWAVYGGGKAGCANRAVRLHLGFHLLDDKPMRATITTGKRCERAVWWENHRAGDAYVGDRYFGQDYGLLDELDRDGCQYVVRMRDQAVVQIKEELALSEADRAAGVVRQAWVWLGAEGCGKRQAVRMVWIENEGASLQVVTNVAVETMSGQLVALLYRHRWQVELFFRWIKCILGVGHWMAESQTGVSVQVYLALIASVLLQLYSGSRPSKRMMEMLQFYLMGWAGEEEVEAALRREIARRKKNP